MGILHIVLLDPKHKDEKIKAALNILKRSNPENHTHGPCNESKGDQSTRAVAPKARF